MQEEISLDFRKGSLLISSTYMESGSLKAGSLLSSPIFEGEMSGWGKLLDSAPVD